MAYVLALISLVSALVLISGCSSQQPQAQVRGTHSGGLRAPFNLKPGVTLNYTPSNGDELYSLRTDLIILIKMKKITSEEARAFLRSQKRRLGLQDPDRTIVFDQMLRDAGLG